MAINFKIIFESFRPNLDELKKDLRKLIDENESQKIQDGLYRYLDDLILDGQFPHLERVIRFLIENDLFKTELITRLEDWNSSDEVNVINISKKFLPRLKANQSNIDPSKKHADIIDDSLSEDEMKILKKLSTMVLKNNTVNQLRIFRLKPLNQLDKKTKSIAIIPEKDYNENIGIELTAEGFTLVSDYSSVLETIRKPEHFNFLLADLLISPEPSIYLKEFKNRRELLKELFELNPLAEFYDVTYSSKNKDKYLEYDGLKIYYDNPKPEGNPYIINQIINKLLEPKFENVDLDDKEVALIMCLLPKDTSNILYKFIKTGFSGTKNLLIHPLSDFLEQRKSYVVKIGKKGKIKEEYENVRKFIKDNLTPSLDIKMESFEDENIAAIRYDYASIDIDIKSFSLKDIYTDLEKFKQVCKENESQIDFLCDIIRDLFENRLKGFMKIEPISRIVERTFEDYIKVEIIENAEKILPKVKTDVKLNLYGIDFQNPLKIWEKLKSIEYPQVPQKIVHGDLHTDNIMIDSRRNIFLIDFGKSTDMGHLFLDHVMMEISIKFDLLARNIPYSEIFKLENILIDKSSIEIKNPFNCEYVSINDCYKLISIIRKNAYEMSQKWSEHYNCDYIYQYYLALFSLTYAQLAFPDMNQQYALYSSGKIAEEILL